MNFDLILNLFRKHITDKTDLATGAQELELLLQEHFQISFLDKIDLNRLDRDFKKEVENILSNNRIPNNIQALYFGLTTVSGKDYNEETSIYINGTIVSPDDDEEWACDADYQGKKHIYPTDFELIDVSLAEGIEDKGTIEVLIFNGLLNLLVLNNTELIKALTFDSNGTVSESRQALWLGAGYDSGDVYVLAQIH